MSSLPYYAFACLFFWGQTTQPDRLRSSRRGGRAPGFGEAFNATPEERDQRRINRWVASAARAYDLDENQKARVRQEMETIRAERRVAMGPQAAELDQLRRQLADMWRIPAGDPVQREDIRKRWQKLRDDEAFQMIRTRIDEIEKHHPFDWDSSRERVETLLRPDQVQKAEQRRAQRAARRDRNAPRFGQTAQPGNAAAPATTSSPEFTRPTEAAPREVDPWEAFVQRFTLEREFTEAQSNAANAILKDMLGRRAQLMRAGNEKRLDARTKSENPNPEVERLFEQLKARLDGLLTAAQRAKASKLDGSPPTPPG